MGGYPTRGPLAAISELYRHVSTGISHGEVESELDEREPSGLCVGERESGRGVSNLYDQRLLLQGGDNR